MGLKCIESQKSFTRRTGKASLLAVLLSGASSTAAMAVTVPSQVEPSHVEKQISNPQGNLTPTNRVQTPAAPGLSSAQQAALAKQHFVLKNVSITGATVFKQEDMRSAYASQLGKDISMLDAYGIARHITNMYRDHDYVLSQARVESVSGGTLKIRVIEGYISKVTIQGDTHERNRKLLESYAANLTHQRPVKTADLERYLLLMDDLPGAHARGLVRPSASALGGADLVVTLSHKMFEGSYTLDNRGTKFVGPWQHTGILVGNSLLGLYDRTLLRIATTSPTTELRLFNLQHEEQIDSEGTRLIFDVAHSHTEPGDSLKATAIRGDSNSFEAKVTHPFTRSRRENLVGRVLFDVRNTYTDVFSYEDFSEDRSRVVRAGAEYDFGDALNAVDLVDGQISQGLSWFNASTKTDPVPPSNSLGDGVFTKLNLDVSRTQPLTHNFSLFTAGTGQYAFQPLPTGEQFTLGGVGFGQAYDPAELSGDHGLAGKVELRYGEALNDHYLQSYQLYSYYDIGSVWLRDTAVGVDDHKSLASLGVGIRTNFSENLSSYLEVAKPLTKNANNQGGHGDDPRIFFSATARF